MGAAEAARLRPPPRGILYGSEQAVVTPNIPYRRRSVLATSGIGVVMIGTVFMAVGAGACAERWAAKAGTVREATSVSHKLSAGVCAWAQRSSGRATAVLIRTQGAIGASERRALKKAGVDVISTSGDVVAGYVHSAALARLARLNFVRYVELSRPLPVSHRSVP